MISSAPITSPPGAVPERAGLTGWPLVTLLAAIQFAAFADRFLLPLVATPLNQSLGLSDTQLGLLQGSAFALPYALALPLSLLGFAGLVALLGFSSPPGLAGIQLLTPQRLRGRDNALFLATVTLAGFGLGPLLVGLLSDHLFGEAGLGFALVAVYAPVGGLGAVAALFARRAWRPAQRRTR